MQTAVLHLDLSLNKTAKKNRRVFQILGLLFCECMCKRKLECVAALNGIQGIS